MSKELTFYFDPGCPWTWRASLWIRQVAELRSLDVHWDFVSLAAINDKEGRKLADMGDFWSGKALRTLALVKQQQGDAAVDKLYMAIGEAHFDDKQDINETATIEGALEAAGFDKGLLQQALDDSSTVAAVQKSHDYIMSHKAVGSPSLVLQDGDQTSAPWYGPVIGQVPVGEKAGEFWDVVEKLMWWPEFFELKRNR